MLVTRRALSLDERERILGFLLVHFCGGQLRRGSISEAAQEFGRSHSTISDFWNVWKRSYSIDKQYTRHSVRVQNKIFDRRVLQAELRRVRIADRTSIRAVAERLGVSKSTVHRMIHQEGIICIHSNAVKPTLTFENKERRLKVSNE